MDSKELKFKRKHLNDYCDHCPAGDNYCLPHAKKPMTFCTEYVFDKIAPVDALGGPVWVPSENKSFEEFIDILKCTHQYNPPLLIRYLYGNGELDGIYQMARDIAEESAKKGARIIRKKFSSDPQDKKMLNGGEQGRLFRQYRTDIQSHIADIGHAVIARNFKNPAIRTIILGVLVEDVVSAARLMIAENVDEYFTRYVLHMKPEKEEEPKED